MDYGYEGNEIRQLASALRCTHVVPSLGARVSRRITTVRGASKRERAVVPPLHGFRPIFSRFEKLGGLSPGSSGLRLSSMCYIRY